MQHHLVLDIRFSIFDDNLTGLKIQIEHRVGSAIACHGEVTP
jgi:hypothetical protein